MATSQEIEEALKEAGWVAITPNYSNNPSMLVHPTKNLVWHCGGWIKTSRRMSIPTSKFKGQVDWSTFHMKDNEYYVPLKYLGLPHLSLFKINKEAKILIDEAEIIAINYG